jgi:hypothetical protein
MLYYVDALMYMGIRIPGNRRFRTEETCRRAFYSHGVIHELCTLYRLVTDPLLRRNPRYTFFSKS